MRRCAARAAKYGLDSGSQFAGAEGFRNVVVTTQFQSDNPVNFAFASGEKEEWNIRRFSDFPTNIKSGDVRQADVKNEKVVRLFLKLFDRLCPRADVGDSKAVSLQRINQGLRDRRFIFYDEDGDLAHGIRKEKVSPADQKVAGCLGGRRRVPYCSPGQNRKPGFCEMISYFARRNSGIRKLEFGS